MSEMEMLQNRIKILETVLFALVGSDRYRLQKHLEIRDGSNILLGKTYGTKIGTESTQLLGFYGATPVDRPDAVSDPSGGATQDSQARTAIISVIDRLQEVGLIA